MIPPQVNGATLKLVKSIKYTKGFPMIPPQVNGATLLAASLNDPLDQFPMIPPQVNGATIGTVLIWMINGTSFQ